LGLVAYLAWLRDTRTDLSILFALGLVLLAIGEPLVLAVAGWWEPSWAEGLRRISPWPRRLLLGGVPAMVLLGGVLLLDFRAFRRDRQPCLGDRGEVSGGTVAPEGRNPS